jgi:predicted  nucleic acid-binding Zn-ribbon protein
MQAVKRLHDLQQIDLRIEELKTALTDVRVRLADNSALTTAAAGVAKLTADLDELGTRRKAAERTIAEVQEKLQTVESRLYGGTVTSARELSAAEEERGFVVQHLKEGEDDLLELMVETEDFETAQREAQETLADLEANRPAEQTELHTSEERTSAELDQQRQRRDQMVPEVPADLLALYDSLRKRTNGTPVARVAQGMCQGCRLTLSTMELQRARTAQSAIRCSSCKRILYLP